jgi:hypothetical protein
MKGKVILVALLIGLIVLAGVSIVQYQALNRISNENAQLEKVTELVGNGAVYQSEYDLRYGLDFRTTKRWNDSETGFISAEYETHLLEPWYCAVYSPHDNFTLNISLSSMTSDPSDLNITIIPCPAYMPTVQSGNVFDLRTNETAPIIWCTNETGPATYSISLASMGWYTISLYGPLMYDEEEQQVRLDAESRNSTDPYLEMWFSKWQRWPFFFPHDDYEGFVYYWLASLTMTYSGTASPFIITTSALQGD